jgi:hypothetical protein
MRRLAPVLAASLAVAAAFAPPGAAVRSPICGHGTIPVEVDPRGLLPLETNSIAPAAAAGLAHESAKDKPLVLGATLAAADQDRGPIAKRECGARVWERTVVVYIRLRAFLPSASLSERVSFVGRFKDGYRVWQVEH